MLTFIKNLIKRIKVAAYIFDIVEGARAKNKKGPRYNYKEIGKAIVDIVA